MVVCENIFFKIQSEFSVQTMTKEQLLIDYCYKTIYQPIRTQCCSCRVYNEDSSVFNFIQFFGKDGKSGRFHGWLQAPLGNPDYATYLVRLEVGMPLNLICDMLC